MNRPLSRLLDILYCIKRIEEYMQGIEFEDLTEEKMDAVIRKLEIIGEAGKNIPDDVRTQYPEVPWAKIIGLRNRLVHDYANVDEEVIWNIVKLRLPEIKPHIEMAIKEVKE